MDERAANSFEKEAPFQKTRLTSCIFKKIHDLALMLWCSVSCPEICELTGAGMRFVEGVPFCDSGISTG
jgi:hypothetical protein